MSMQPQYQSKAHEVPILTWNASINWITSNNETKIASLQFYDYSEKSYLLSAEPEFITAYQEHLATVGMVNFKYKIPFKFGVAIAKKKYQPQKIQSLINEIMNGTIRPTAAPVNYVQPQATHSQPQMNGASMLDQLRQGSSNYVSQPEVMSHGTISNLNSLSSAFSSMNIKQQSEPASIPGIPRATPTLDASLNALWESFKKRTEQGMFKCGNEDFIVCTHSMSMEYFPSYDYVIENTQGMCLMRKKAQFNLLDVVSALDEECNNLSESGHLNIGAYSFVWQKVNDESKADCSIGNLTFENNSIIVCIGMRHGESSSPSTMKTLIFNLYRAICTAFPPCTSKVFGDVTKDVFSRLTFENMNLVFHK